MRPSRSRAIQETVPDSQPTAGGLAAKCRLVKGSLGEDSIRARRSDAALSWVSLSNSFICRGARAENTRQMRQTSIRNDIRLFIAEGYHWVDMRRASSDISQAANAIVARATATPMNQRECEYHPSGEGGATPTGPQRSGLSCLDAPVHRHDNT